METYRYGKESGGVGVGGGGRGGSSISSRAAGGHLCSTLIIRANRFRWASLILHDLRWQDLYEQLSVPIRCGRYSSNNNRWGRWRVGIGNMAAPAVFISLPLVPDAVS